MNSDFGAPSLSARMVIGAVIIKHMLNIDDREVVAQMTGEHVPAIFGGIKQFYHQRTFDRSLLVIIRYRLGQDVMEEFNQLVLQQAGLLDCPDGKELVAAVKLHPSIGNEIYTGKRLETFASPYES
jgi:hypothetical protein